MTFDKQKEYILKGNVYNDLTLELIYAKKSS